MSRDLGRRWTDITGTVLAPRTVFRLEGDDRRTGVVYVATDTGVYRYYGGGVPVCLDSRAGLEAIRLRPGACSAIPEPGHATGPATGSSAAGDVIAVEVANVAAGSGFVSLGEVECLVDNGEISLVSLDTPDPAPGRALAILARSAGATDYGYSSSGMPRRPALGDCP